jgi:phosphonate transport system substrate-binding protein
MKGRKIWMVAIAALFAATAAFASGSKEAYTFVWLPNDSVPESKVFRTALEKIITDATGRPVVEKLTTDYNIAIEAMASNNAAFASFGGLQYVQSHQKNDKIVPLVTNSGNSGTMADAHYFSRISVKSEDAPPYMSGSDYTIDKIQGKRFAFVSNSSTSGFLFPSSGIVGYFRKMASWSKLVPNDLIEGGQDKFFSQVIFGGSHQGSAAALLSNKVDAAAFDDTDLVPYVELVSGQESTPGAVYKIKDGAAEPFDTLAGKSFTVIWAIPVLNGPICANSNLVSADDQKKIVAALTADSTAANQAIFPAPDYNGPNKTGFPKQTGKIKFLAVDDTTYQPIRDKIQ